jgi:pyruvate kinase
LSQQNPQILLETLQDLKTEVDRDCQDIFNNWRSRISRRPFLVSGVNLAQYLALRQHDLRDLQRSLMPWGLSSLGRCEARVMPNLDAAIASLGVLCHANRDDLPEHPSYRRFFRGERFLHRHTRDLLGFSPSQRWVQIMVTVPDEAATDYNFFREILQRGANSVRINCAKGSQDEWESMIQNLRKAEAEVGRKCKLLMDLGGIQPRTEEVVMGDRRLFVGDRFLLVRDEFRPPQDYPYQVNCTLPEYLQQLEIGQTVWIDDGKLGGRVEKIEPDAITLEVIQARPDKGEKLKPQKGLNFPDTPLEFSSLTTKDKQDLDFIADRADIVGHSFVQTAADLERLQQELYLRRGDRPHLGIIAKIETTKGIKNLPEIIVQGAGRQPFGVMIARGDLAVEIGYQRLAEMQEEILWICEAAHVPVIWATQVLRHLAKKGLPLRSEITDAAMAERAECVMLNKGPFIPEAITILDDVLTRMQAHQIKKTPQLRALQSW